MSLFQVGYLVGGMMILSGAAWFCCEVIKPICEHRRQQRYMNNCDLDDSALTEIEIEIKDGVALSSTSHPRLRLNYGGLWGSGDEASINIICYSCREPFVSNLDYENWDICDQCLTRRRVDALPIHVICLELLPENKVAVYGYAAPSAEHPDGAISGAALQPGPQASERAPSAARLPILSEPATEPTECLPPEQRPVAVTGTRTRPIQSECLFFCTNASCGRVSHCDCSPDAAGHADCECCYCGSRSSESPHTDFPSPLPDHERKRGQQQKSISAYHTAQRGYLPIPRGGGVYPVARISDPEPGYAAILPESVLGAESGGLSIAAAGQTLRDARDTGLGRDESAADREPGLRLEGSGSGGEVKGECAPGNEPSSTEPLPN